MSAVVYHIENLITGSLYIGKTNNPRRRFFQHRYALENKKHCNAHLQNAWNKYGAKAFRFKVRRVYVSCTEALAAEVKLIARLRAAGIILYNMTNGGENGSRKPRRRK